MDRHIDRVCIFCSCHLDKKCASAVKPTTCTAQFKLLGKYITKYNFPKECIYGSDETGFQLGCFYARHVIGPAGEKIVKEVTGDGNRENITVLVTICADGSTIPPLVIFKGETYFCKWGENNLLKSCPSLEAHDCIALDIKIFLLLCCSKREMLISENKIVTHHYTCFSNKQT